MPTTDREVPQAMLKRPSSGESIPYFCAGTKSDGGVTKVTEATRREYRAALRGAGQEFEDRHESVIPLHPRKRLSRAACNIQVRYSRREIVVIVASHCEAPDNRMLRNLADAFQKSSADCTFSPQSLDVKHATTLQRAIAAVRSFRLGHHLGSFIYPSSPQFVPAKRVAVAYRRDVFDKVGLFNERFDACKDDRS